MQIGVIGAGYVGLVTATCFAEMGNRVICVERDPQRVAMLSRGEVPIYEPGLEAMLKAQLASGQLSFTSQLPPRHPRGPGGVLARGGGGRRRAGR
ncbi:NAD-binding protein, partial [Ectopseudomonas khazarica]|uniref:NAD-binding protein n=1 Tax=Ectopseudomonas khazarica TaxID=2502979 RepID=UPI003B95D185